MPFEIEFENQLTPAGYAVAAARSSDATALVEMRGFTSSEDGELFVSRLEGIPNTIVNRLPPEARIHPPQVQELLAIVRRGGTATVYVNELRVLMKVQPKRPMVVGQKVFKDDIADLQAIQLAGVDVPADCGVVFVFSIGWRKGFFYDLEPVAGPDPQPRDYDLSAALGQCFSQVFFQEMFSITDTTWDNIISQQWFPFRGLSSGTIKLIVSHADNGWAIDELLDQIATEVRGRLSAGLESWSKSPIFVNHSALLVQAVDRFQNDDFLSCCSILYPRIEGLLRAFHTTKGEATRPSQENLSASAVQNPWTNRHSNCILLPGKFQRYLKQVYFAGFDVPSGSVPVSRHSVAHGVAPTGVFSLKSAVIAFLIVEQLGFYFAPSQGVVQPA